MSNELQRAHKRAIFFAIFRSDQVSQALIDSTYRDSAQRGVLEIAKWEGFQEWAKISLDKAFELGKLRELSEAHPTDLDLRSYVARGLSTYQEYGEAGELYLSAASEATSDDKRLAYFARACISQASADDLSGMAATTRSMRAIIQSNPSLELDYLRTIVEAAEIAKDVDTGIAAMERIVEIAPDDDSIRFKLAYAHGDASREDQALDHYLRIPHQERTQSTWNNLGVAFDNFKMHGKAVAAYRRAKELGETLAMSNLGNKYLLSGFLEDAQAECDGALAIPEYHKNVGTLAARLRELPDEEEKTQTEVLEKAKPSAEFFRELGRSISKSDAIIEGEWQGPDCRFSVATVLNLCTAEGEYERDNSNALALALAVISSPLKNKSKYKVTMTGSLNGHMLKGLVHREEIGSQSTGAGLLSLGGDSQFIAFLSEDLLTISVLENPASAWSRMYQLRKLRHVSSQTAIPV